VTCPNCGKPTREGAVFCGECGFKLTLAAAAAVPVEAPVTDAPLRRPPPPPGDDADENEVPAPILVVSPEVEPIFVVPPPPVGVPKEVEVVPFGSTEEVEVRSRPSSSDLIAAPPGIDDPPPAGAAPVIAIPVASTPESMDETRVSVRRKAGVHWRLVLPDGRHVEVASAVMLGRDPAANAKWPGAAKLPIDDDTHSTSKTHAVIEVDGGELWITDLNSTNGVVIIQSDGTEIDLEPNVRAQIKPGADVELGDYVVQVEKD
jgi:hypothetical protein